MNVFMLIEEVDQDEFLDNYGESAYPTSNVVGVYESRKRAEQEKDALEKKDKNRVDAIGTDPCSYLIEERPLLQ